MNIILVVVIIAVAVYDFTNGFHDAADMVATPIASHAMRPSVAIGIVSAFTFIAPFTIGLAVANTIGTFVNIGSASSLAGECAGRRYLTTAYKKTESRCFQNGANSRSI